MNWLERHLGEAIVATGAVHIVYGLAVHRPQVAAAWSDGLLNAAPGRGERNEALWFVTGGGLMIGAGLLARSHRDETGDLPASFGGALLATALVNGALQPASGIWLVAAEGALALRLAARRSAS